MNLADTVHRLTAPLRRRVDNMVARAVVRMVRDSPKMQELQAELLPGELRNLERFQNYGFTAVPLPGAEAVVVFAGGDRAHGLAVAVDDRRYRMKGLQPGEVAIYTDEGDSIKLARGRVIEVTAGAKLAVTAPEVDITASMKVMITSPEVEMSGNLTVTGNITGDAVATDAGVDLGTHLHSGVTPGGANTGGPV